ncbi:MAG: DivIVA domain-containing protein [Algoriphagus sp.]|uniref:DivIVA domain-containing protein n=1 Tax=Algoriphagus sp. TaxID=1872435 RepID=UPI002618D36A|nr:DivIVA domain-containing protein [Algoriphagus sp.]MDG1278287.1 DivIVA domain-containing protein [Algoriphagus sp.]
MKITPAAIRQKSFETGFRGFEKKEVSSFLEEISEVVDALHKENMDLKTKLQNTEAEAKRLKDVEDSLFRTLKTAEDTGASIIEEANEAADLIIAEANQSAESATNHANKILASARQIAEQDAATIISAAETKAKETIVELRESMQGLVRSYEGLAEQREAMVKSLKRIAQDALNQIDLSEAHFSRIDAKAHQRAIEELSRSQAFTFANLANLAPEVSNEFVAPIIDESDPLAEMEIIEEELDLEIHDNSPDMEIPVEEESIEVKSEVEIEEIAIEESVAIEEIQEEVAEVEIKEKEIPKAEESNPEEIQKKKPEDLKNESGSFFDQFD